MAPPVMVYADSASAEMALNRYSGTDILDLHGLRHWWRSTENAAAPLSH